MAAHDMSRDVTTKITVVDSTAPHAGASMVGGQVVPDIVPSGAPPWLKELSPLINNIGNALLQRSAAPAPSSAGGSQPPSFQTLVVVAIMLLGGALGWVAVRVETSHTLAEQAVAASKSTPNLEAQIAAQAKDIDDDRVAQSKINDLLMSTLRNSLIVLAEDRRAVWDALNRIFTRVKAPGDPDLRMPSTDQRLDEQRAQLP